MILVTKQAKLLKVSGIEAQMDPALLADLHSWGFLQECIKSSLQRIDGKSAVSAEGLKGLTLQYPLAKPDKTVLEPLSSIRAGEENAAVLAFNALLFLPCTPPNYTQTATRPAPLFLVFAMHKKSLVKPLSLNFLQTLARTESRPVLPTIFQYYAVCYQL